MTALLNHPIISALVGGALIGLSAASMLALNGQITGLSGFIYEPFAHGTRAQAWRLAFLGGLLSGGFLMVLIDPALFTNTTGVSTIMLIVSGLLVGFGTRLGGGCTSGHGVCGVSRLSPRSLVATAVFLGIGIITATCISKWGLI